MIYKQKNGVLVTCDCSCGNSMEIKTLNFDEEEKKEEVYFDFFQSLFYTKQNSFFWNKKEKIRKLIKKNKEKGILLFDIVLKEQDVKEFIQQIETIEKKLQDTNDPKENDSYVVLEKISEESEANKLYELCLYTKQNTIRFIKKEYQSYEICFNKKQFKEFINLCKKQL